MKALHTPFRDPYNDLSDDEFEEEVLRALEQSTEKISLRMPSDLLQRTRSAAQTRGVPYQSLIKVLVDQGVRRLERTRSTSSRTADLTAKLTAKPADNNARRRTSVESRSTRSNVRGRRRTSTDTPPST
jgi:predicted DNA binding CopG/RHH family protein